MKDKGLPVNLILNNARISSSLSFTSSLLIFIAIFRSQIKLKRIYNRIMLGVSIMDIVSSLAMSFTTLPMPASYDESMLPGASGTIATCNTQGFAMTAGYMGSMLYTTGLSLYYLCRIRFHMSDDVFKERIESKIHVLCILIPLNLCVSATFCQSDVHLLVGKRFYLLLNNF